MKYYKAKQECYDYFTKNCAIKNGLYTEKEKNKYFPHIIESHFEIIETKRTNTFTCFGVRFLKADYQKH